MQTYRYINLPSGALSDLTYTYNPETNILSEVDPQSPACWLITFKVIFKRGNFVCLDSKYNPALLVEVEDA